jgi:tRNA threonylcarbamoyladenosine biosynthesis protein TsaE
MRLRSQSLAETLAVARALAASVGAEGAAVALVGPLGAGKTAFAKGVAEGLGLPRDLLASPTFTIAQEVEAPSGLRLVHADLFRVASPAELEAAGWLDWLAPGVLLLVEWADRLPAELPSDHVLVELAPLGAEARELRVEARGPRSRELVARLAGALAAAGVPLTDAAA